MATKATPIELLSISIEAMEDGLRVARAELGRMLREERAIANAIEMVRDGEIDRDDAMTSLLADDGISYEVSEAALDAAFASDDDDENLQGYLDDCG